MKSSRSILFLTGLALLSPVSHAAADQTFSGPARIRGEITRDFSFEILKFKVRSQILTARNGDRANATAASQVQRLAGATIYGAYEGEINRAVNTGNNPSRSSANQRILFRKRIIQFPGGKFTLRKRLDPDRVGRQTFSGRGMLRARG